MTLAFNYPRVVVTGVGAVTPLGATASELWDNLLAGVSGVGRITLFDPTDFAVQIAGEVQGWDAIASKAFELLELKRLDRGAQMAIVSAVEAVAGAGLRDAALGDRLGVVFGTGVGGLQETTEQAAVLQSRGPRRVSPHMISKIIPNSAAGYLAIRLGARGPVSSVSTACATGADAIASAMALIRQGRVDVVVAGGAEAVVTPVAIAGFSQMKGLSTRNEEPQRASRPFDSERDGFVLSEGAGALVLESLQHAVARGAPILAELLGAGQSCDAYHIATPRPDSSGIVSAIRWCLTDAGLTPHQIAYVNAHATSTPLGDACELRALESVFEDVRQPPLVSSTKGQLGHLLGASGAVEAVIAVQAAARRVAPPCFNCETPDATSLNLLTDAPTELGDGVVLSTSFGFGGHNTCLAFGQAPSNDPATNSRLD